MARVLAVLLISLLFSASFALSGETADDEFGGVGLQVVPTVEGDLVVLRVVEKSPAAQSGLMAKLVKIGDIGQWIPNNIG